MGIILWIIFGAIVGWAASAITHSNDSLLMDIVIGIVGAVVGGWLMSFFGQTGITGFNFYSFAVAVLGSVVLIALVRSFRQTV
jgi:uncharacterized membrane protein YeaQ/YmgE (transglycosylase-associated protein family)